MSYYKKYSGGGFYDKKSGQWISSTRAHQKVGESIGGWTKRRARDGSYYMERDDDWDDDDDDWDYDWDDDDDEWDDDDDDEWDYNRKIPEKRLHQKVGESIDGYTKRISKSGKYYMEKDDDRNSNYRSNKWGKRRYW